MRRQRHLPMLLGLCVLAPWSADLDAWADPENLALKAKASASSEFNEDYAAEYAVDGIVPDLMSRQDAHKAWCIRRYEAGDVGSFTLEWPEPVQVAEVVYFGRTAQIISECWRDFEVYLDEATEPVASGAFKMIHGPQRIPIPPTRATRVTLKFLNSYGPHNPGASEIAVYSASPTDEQLAAMSPGAELREEFAEGRFGFRDLLLIKRQPLVLSHVYVYHAEGFMPGGGLYVYSPGENGGAVREVVSSPEGMIIDADLSYDGREIVFSWKRTGTVLTTPLNYQTEEHCRTIPDENYQIYRVNIDGTGLTQLTDGPHNNLNACWLPDGGIAFLSDRKPAYAYCFITTSPVLYRMDRDGGGQDRLSSNYLMDFTPSVLDDGRILYTRWEYVDRGACPIQSLWTINPDGTGLSGFFGNRLLSPGTLMEAHSIEGTGKVLALATNHNGSCVGGVCIIDPARGANSQDAITNVTPEVDLYAVAGVYGNGLVGPYETPYPIDEEAFLVSVGGSIQLRTCDGEQAATLVPAPDGMGYYSPRPVRPRKRPPALSPTREPEERRGSWATVVLQDVYNGLGPTIKRGEVKQICVVQEIEKSVFTPLLHKVPTAVGYAANSAFGYQFPLVSCGATYAPKKIWGYADVAEDGSASFRVPAEAPIYFMALDEYGRAVQRMRTFTHLMPGETQGCIGCHADRNSGAPQTAPGNRGPIGAPQDLIAPEWGVEGFSYSRIVQPVLDRHCVGCHNAYSAPADVDLSGDKTDFFSVSYDILARKGTLGERNPGEHGVPLSSKLEGASPYTSWISTINGAEWNILEIAPKRWGSPASPLADLILSGHPDAQGQVRVDLSDADRRRVFSWIDLNVPYYDTSASVHQDKMGCRRLYPVELDPVLTEVADRRCISCHAEGAPRDFYVRITNPELNGFLLAPLAEAAGGTQACGAVVFETVDDPDYVAILEAFEPIQELVATRPREDMASAK